MLLFFSYIICCYLVVIWRFTFCLLGFTFCAGCAGCAVATIRSFFLKGNSADFSLNFSSTFFFCNTTGCQVTAVESNPIMFALLEDGIRRAKEGVCYYYCYCCYYYYYCYCYWSYLLLLVRMYFALHALFYLIHCDFDIIFNSFCLYFLFVFLLYFLSRIACIIFHSHTHSLPTLLRLPLALHSSTQTQNNSWQH